MFVELEPWTQDGRMQPFTISVSTSAMLILDLHSHLGTEVAEVKLSEIHIIAMIWSFHPTTNRSSLGLINPKLIDYAYWNKTNIIPSCANH